MPHPAQMMAIVFDGPRRISIQPRPKPQVQDNGDIIVRVEAAGLCGSELHVYRGHQPSDVGFIMGHEFTGVVVEVGKEVRSIRVHDRIVSPFTVSCMECFYCRHGLSSRCSRGQLFGTSSLDGGQAEFVRIPHADGTVFKAPPNIPNEALVLMADIWPTGFFGAKTGFEHLSPEERDDAVVVVVGCGPVGLCSIIAALEYRPKKLFAIDSVESRLQAAQTLGAEPVNFKSGSEAMVGRVMGATDGRGADVVIEVVGLSPALRTAFDLVRPGGVISSIGVHNGEMPWTAREAYGKNLRLQMGRCPVRSVFPEALALLEKKQNQVGILLDKTMPLADAVEGYRLFDEMAVQKVIFIP